MTTSVSTKSLQFYRLVRTRSNHSGLIAVLFIINCELYTLHPTLYFSPQCYLIIFNTSSYFTIPTPLSSLPSSLLSLYPFFLSPIPSHPIPKPIAIHLPSPYLPYIPPRASMPHFGQTILSPRQTTRTHLTPPDRRKREREFFQLRHGPRHRKSSSPKCECECGCVLGCLEL